MARTRLQTSRGRSRAGGGGLDQLVTALAAAFARLNNPADRQAQLMFAAALLVVEAALCFLIIQRVPCEPCWHDSTLFLAVCLPIDRRPASSELLIWLQTQRSTGRLTCRR